jgi:hypothetical protein
MAILSSTSRGDYEKIPILDGPDFGLQVNPIPAVAHWWRQQHVTAAQHAFGVAARLGTVGFVDPTSLENMVGIIILHKQAPD